jgi:hypothetical protein
MSENGRVLHRVSITVLVAGGAVPRQKNKLANTHEMKNSILSKTGTMLAVGMAMAAASNSAQAAASGGSTGPWKFGIMSDTQWTGNPADPVNNPGSVTVSMIKQVDPQFINAGVKFVIQVGDLTDDGSNTGLDARAAAAQDLYDAGIGFFPLCGNHESSKTGANRATNDFPQTQGLGTHLFGAQNFTGPAIAGLKGLTYAFEYNNAKFILLDQFIRLDGSATDVNSAMLDQIPWIVSAASATPQGNHNFVFGHKNLIGENHTDVLLGADPSKNPTYQNTFIDSLASLGVKYYFSGHDHVHQRSIVTSPDKTSQLEEIICGSDSSKFYTPALPSNDQQYDAKYLGFLRETSVAQDTYRVTYYIVTVDGPRMTVDYYASDETFPSGNSPSPTPTLHFHKRETFGYSLTGKDFYIAQGGAYSVVQDTSVHGTSARILGGINGSTVKDASNRQLVREVTTGWSAVSGTDVFTLWGMADIGATSTDVYPLSMSFATAGFTSAQLQNGYAFLATRDANGNWINAVDANTGGVNSFVAGSWDPTYPLGTWGVDPVTGTAWAVINHASDFAVLRGLVGDLNGDGLVNQDDLTLEQTAIRTRSSSPAYDLNGDGKVDAADLRWLSLHLSH